MNIGYDIELLFEQRLRQLGYCAVCRPAREDCGVDFVVFTTKGWIGIQVKSAKRNNRQGSGNLRVRLDGMPRKPLKREVLYDRGKSLAKYLRVGVTVFALHNQGVFYLVPITESSATTGVYVSGHSVFREAWYQVLGEPVDPVTPEAQREEEIAEMESLFAKESL